jgi:glucose/arabinose dehydrogenase
MRVRLFVMAAVLAAAACGDATGQNAGQNTGRHPTGSGAPVESGPPNAPDQKPAFAGQTRAPEVKSKTAWATETVVHGLDHPWGMAFLPDGRMLVTEKPGRLRIVTTQGQMSEPIAGLPKVDARNQGGLLDVTLSPDFKRDRLVYVSYAEPREGGNGTAVARGKLSADGTRLEDVQAIFHELPTLDSTAHFGGRLVFARDGKLFVTLGERFITAGRVQAQDLNSDLGKIVRLNADGSVPRDNPFVGRQGARPEIWSWGHRNVQAAALDGRGRFWEIEHGTRGGDELNRPEAGKNYGWPIAAYGIEYKGGPIGEGHTQAPGTEQPLYYWDPVIAPSGMLFYSGALFPEWRGNVLVGGLQSKGLVRLVLKDDRVVGEERLPMGARVRDVEQGPDGALWVLTDEADGKLIRVTPRR